MINKPSDTYIIDLEPSCFNEGDVVNVKVYFTIEGGKMEASVDVPDGTITEIDENPGSEFVLAGQISVESSIKENAIPISLRVVDDAAEEIDSKIGISLPW